MKISEHYTDLDVSFDLLATKSKIDNKPSRAVLINAEVLAENILEPLREEGFDFRIASWYRSNALEREYCKLSFHNWTREQGLPFNESSWATYLRDKQHIHGYAVAIVSNDNQQIFEWLQNHTFDLLQLRKDYIYVSYVDGKNRKMVLK